MTQALPSLFKMQYNIIGRFQQDYVFCWLDHKITLSDTFHIFLARRLGVAKQSNHVFRSFSLYLSRGADMRFVKNFTPPYFQAKDFTPLISLNFNSFSDKNTKKWVFLEKFTPLAKNFTLPAAVTAVTNLTSDSDHKQKNSTKSLLDLPSATYIWFQWCCTFF